MPRTARPPRLPPVLLEALFPSPQLLAGRLAASTVAMYTRDCAAYVAFCGYDGARAVAGRDAAPLAHLPGRGYGAVAAYHQPHAGGRQARAPGGGRAGRASAREVRGPVRRSRGCSVAALRHRLKATARVRLTPAQMRQLCDAPDPRRCSGCAIARCSPRWRARAAASPRW